MLNKKIVILICLVSLSLISLSACILGFYRLDRIPYGFHVDEYSTSVDIACMATEGVDAHNVSHPIFSNLNYGTPKPPTFIYPAILWAKVFGYSIASLRALSVTIHILGIIGLFFLARLFFGWRYALLTVTVASLSPWVWGLSRIAFESLFSATFLIWGMYCFFKSPKIWSVSLSALFFSAAMYSYPPFRLQIPLMLLTLIVYSRFQKVSWALKSWIIFIIEMMVLLIPLIQKTLSGEIQERFNEISIFSQGYLNSIHSPGHLRDIVGIFMNNYLMHLKWNFLFLTGDPSYVHSTRHFGILGWLDILALGLAFIWVLMLFFKDHRANNPLVLQRNFVLFLLVNIFIGVLPAALTNSELPNSLRITGAWPFMCLFSGYLIWQACEHWVVLWVVTCILSVIFAVIFFNVYFNVYPQEAKGMFAYWTLEEASHLKTDEDWLKFLLLYRYKDYTARYFLMQYRGLSCTQSRNVWEGMRDYLKSRGTY